MHVTIANVVSIAKNILVEPSKHCLIELEVNDKI